MSDKQGGTQWELDEAWKLVIQSRDAGDQDGEAIGMRRFSEGLRNSSLGVVGSVLSPLDKKIDRLTSVIDLHYTQENKARAELRIHIDGQFDRIYKELDRLGGLEARVERVEVGQAKLEIRVDAVETHGAPAKAVDELIQLRADVENIRRMLVLTRRQLWLTFAAVASIALIFLLAILAGGGR